MLYLISHSLFFDYLLLQCCLFDCLFESIFLQISSGVKVKWVEEVLRGKELLFPSLNLKTYF